MGSHSPYRRFTHSAHNSENIVIYSIHADLARTAPRGLGGARRRQGADGLLGQLQVESGIVDTREVASAARLVVHGTQGEAVDTDALARNVLEVLVRLQAVEELAVPLCHAVVAVELQTGPVGRAITRAKVGRHKGADAAPGGNSTGDGVLEDLGVVCGRHRHVFVVGVVEPLPAVLVVVVVAAVLGGTGNVIIGLHHPHKELDGMVEVELELVVFLRGGFISREHQLFYEVFMRNLSVFAALVSIKVDKFYVQAGVGEGTDRERLHRVAKLLFHSSGGSGVLGKEAAVACLAELDVDLDLMVLQSNQRQGKANGAAEPELKGDVQDLAFDNHLGRIHGGAGVLVHGGQAGDVADHVGVAQGAAAGLGQFVPNVEPITVVLVTICATVDTVCRLANLTLRGPLR